MEPLPTIASCIKTQKKANMAMRPFHTSAFNEKRAADNGGHDELPPVLRLLEHRDGALADDRLLNQDPEEREHRDAPVPDLGVQREAPGLPSHVHVPAELAHAPFIKVVVGLERRRGPLRGGHRASRRDGRLQGASRGKQERGDECPRGG